MSIFSFILPKEQTNFIINWIQIINNAKNVNDEIQKEIITV